MVLVNLIGVCACFFFNIIIFNKVTFTLQPDVNAGARAWWYPSSGACGGFRSYAIPLLYPSSSRK